MMKGQITLVPFSGETEGKVRSKSLIGSVNERISRYGVNTILDEEILSVLSDIPLEKIKQFIKDYQEIGEICKHIDLLKVTETQKKKLLMIFEFSKRAKYVGKAKVTLESSTTACSYVMDILSLKAVEEFIMVALNGHNQVIKTFTMSKGTVNESAVYVREIIKKAILHNATSVIVAHNHPSNSMKPSDADMKSTRAIYEALRIVNIKLVDHIIVGDNESLSFAEHGLLPS